MDGEYKDTVGVFIFTLDLITRNYPVITAVEGLSYDCLAITACSTALGGVVVLASNSIIYVDQSSRRVVLPVNGWPPRLSDMSMPVFTPQYFQLAGARLAFVDDRTLFVVLRDGTVYPVEVIVDGKTVSRLSMASPVARTTIPACVRRVEDNYLFIGSIVSPSVLLKTIRVEEDIPEEDVEMTSAPATVVDSTDGMDLDDDDDLYGSSQVQEVLSINGNGNLNGVAVTSKRRTVVHLSLCDSLPAHGPISDMTFALAKNGDRYVPELVTATGAGELGGFTVFQLHAIGDGRGMWSVPVRQAVKVNGSTYERPVNPFYTENDSIIISTDANPSPGASRTSRSPHVSTIGAAPFFQGTAILHVMVNVTNVIRVLEPDGTERQVIKDWDGNDDSIGLFIGETDRGKIRRKDMSPMGEKTSRYLAGCFFTDTTGVFQSHANMEVAGTENVTSTLQAAMNAGNKSQWLLLCRPQIWTLPKLTSGPSLAEWIPNFQLDGHLPWKFIPRDKSYSNVVYDASTSLLVAASSLQNKFASYDEDGNIVWEPDVNRGEDLAIKGVVYIFEIVEVVPDLSSSHKRWYKLKLRCRDDAKGPVTALCGMDGYLVSSMGQKIFVRAFDLDERLVGVAFLDVGVYVTSLRTIKNLGLLLCALRSIFRAGFIVGREPTAPRSLVFVRMMLTPRPSFF
ncbi:CPSF A subunit region-domain-containing protein [Sparassis latifolia]